MYKASDLEANGAVRAVKEIPKSCREMVISATQESQLIRELYEHDKSNFFPNIIQIFDSDNSFYIVMDFINGSSMSSILKNGAFDRSLTLEYGKEICSVMQFLHDYGKIYSDMKPDNIMIVNRNSSISKALNKGRKSGILKLIDFGAVVQMESGIPIQYTPEYAAPEQFMRKRLDIRTDIFNAGATLYHMITGRKPLPVHDRNNNFIKSCDRFVFDSKDKINDAYLKKIIRKCVEDNPDKRYRSFRELYYALEKAEKNSRIKITAFTALTALLSGILCIFSGIKCSSLEATNYEKLIMSAEKSASHSEKLSSYLQAAEICGDRTEAYFGIIEAYKEDISLSEDESAELAKLLTSNLQGLREKPDYELLAFETGKLYWYYYEYGSSRNSDNTTTRMKASSEWFSDALSENLRSISEDKYQMAKIYCDIGNFNSEIQKLVIEGDDKDIYQSYWESLTDMNRFIMESDTETEIVLLETYRMILSSLSTYAYKFSSFADENDIRTLYTDVRRGTENLIPTTEKTREIHQNIRNLYHSAEEAIERAYGG